MKRMIFILMGLVIALGANATAAPTGKPTAIAVSGTGTVQMMPDQATVNATIMSNSDSSGRAISQNNDIYNRVIVALTKLGIARSDIALSNYFVNYNPKPNPMPNQPNYYQRYGYTVNRSFSVTVRTIAKAGSVVDAASGAGVTAINGINFGLSKTDAARAQALRSAVSNAHSEAVAIATAAHLRIVGVRSFSLGYAPQFPRPMMMKTIATVNAAPTEFDASNVSVTVTVSAIYLAAP